MATYKINKLIPILYTENIPETISFFAETIGFSRLAQENDSWAVLGLGEIEIMISIPNAHVSFTQPMFTGSFYFRTSDADEIWEAVKNKCRICYPIENFDFGMREFAIYDNNGYLLQFGQPIEED